MKLWVVIDTSGSMIEGGKRLIARGIVRAIEQFIRLGYASADLVLIGVGDEAAEVGWDANNEFPAELLISRGSFNVTAFTQLLGSQAERVVILTDGSWTRESERMLRKWNDTLPQDTLRIIQIGADTSRFLKDLNVFSTENVFAALDGWLEGDLA